MAAPPSGPDDTPRKDGPAAPATPVWLEETLEGLDPDEYDYQEFKGSLWLSRDREVVGGFLHMLSKQVSAFANGGGGRLLIGIDDEGRIDGGVPVDLKGGGTRSWLEDVVPSSVDPKLKKFNVFEVRGDRPDSAILDGHAVYVIEIEPSEDAPHQAYDHRYYLRIAGKSRPMGHIHLEDVLRRTRHPRVRLGRVGPYGEPQYVESDPRGPKVLLSFRAFLANEGRNLARHVGAEIVLPRPLVNSEVRDRILAQDGVVLTQDPGQLIFFRYHPTPLFPTQSVFFMQFWVVIHGNNYAQVQDDAAIRWTLYADDAPPHVGQVPLVRFKVVRRALGWLHRQGGVPVGQQGSRKGRKRRRRRSKRQVKDSRSTSKS